MLSLVNLLVQAQQILATWQILNISNVLKMVDPLIIQATADTVTLLEILTTALD